MYRQASYKGARRQRLILLNVLFSWVHKSEDHPDLNEEDAYCLWLGLFIQRFEGCILALFREFALKGTFYLSISSLLHFFSSSFTSFFSSWKTFVQMLDPCLDSTFFCRGFLDPWRQIGSGTFYPMTLSSSPEAGFSLSRILKCSSLSLFCRACHSFPSCSY